jgi:uncharacterized protein
MSGLQAVLDFQKVPQETFMVSQAEIMGRGAIGARKIDWTPYFAGAGLGVLSWLMFVVVDDPLGVTTAFAALSGGAAMPFIGADAVAQNTYWKATPPVLNYGALFLFGIVAGGLASALINRQFRIEMVPDVWRARFGASPARRFAWTFVAGAMEMYGARLTGGCTSGHSLSGGMQLALSSWIFTIVIFAAAIATGQIMYRNVR